MEHRPSCHLVGLLLAALTCAGCRSVAPPRVVGAGDSATQRRWAVAYDPYGDSNIGPSVNDVRPPGFDRPPSQTQQSRRFIKSLGVSAAP